MLTSACYDVISGIGLPPRHVSWPQMVYNGFYLTPPEIEGGGGGGGGGGGRAHLILG